MTMAKPSLAQDQTVEEILASIRQVINGETVRATPAAARPATGVMSPARAAAAEPVPSRSGTVTPIHSGQLAATEEAADTAPTDDPPASRARMHDVIEMAIEQALDRVDPGDTRAETAGAAAAGMRPPLRAAVMPLAERPPSREAPRAAR
jgi:cell pole-organizing protein PopZ